MQMAMALNALMVMVFLTMAKQGYAATPPPPPGSALSPSYYDTLCDGGTLKFKVIAFAEVTKKVLADKSLIAALLRLAFHDSFVEGADASVLLDFDSSFPDVEKNSLPNNPSLRGYEVIDAVKDKVEKWCPGVVSCADIIQESARVAMKLLFLSGRLPYDIRYGRRDGSISLNTEALLNLPPPFFLYNQLVTSFANKGLNAKEMLLLSGAHCFGVAHCGTFSRRLYNFFGNGSGTDPSLDPTLAASLKVSCPPNANVNITVPLNTGRNTTAFDNTYYQNILAHRVLFTSDDQLNVGDPTDVNFYAGNNFQFRIDFAAALVKLTEVQVRLFPNGEIRSNCRKRN